MRTYVNHKDLTAVLVLDYLLEVKEAKTTKEIVHDLLEGGPYTSKLPQWVYVRKLLEKLDDEALLVRCGKYWQHEDSAPFFRDRFFDQVIRGRHAEADEEDEASGAFGGIGTERRRHRRRKATARATSPVTH